MTATSTQIAMAKNYLYNVEAAVAASDKTGLPLFILLATLTQESTWPEAGKEPPYKGGQNIFGHDTGGAMYGAGEVTEDKFKQFIQLINGGKTSNGVGPMQITYKGYFPIMESRGLKGWVPADSILFGAEIMKANFDKALAKGYSTEDAIRWAGTWYNLGGSASAVNAYGNHLLELAKTWKTRLDTAPPPPPPPPPPEPPVNIATQRVTFEGQRTTTRSVRMVKEARYLFRLRGGGHYPAITQGGYNKGGVAASAGTHDRDAHDYGTKAFSTTRSLLWEWCVWEVGFAAWRRPYIAGLWPAHTHALPKGGDLSSGAKAQITQWFQGDDALKSDKNYPRIDSSGFKARTWESYLKVRPHGTVDLSGLVKAFKAGGKSPISDNAGDNDVQQVQAALNHFLDSKLSVDGIAGPATKAVYATYQSRKYGVPKGSADANGIPGKDSLQGLGFTVLV